MKGKKLFEEMGNVREDFVQDTAESLYGEKGRGRKTPGKHRNIYRVAAAAAILLLVAGIGMGVRGKLFNHGERDKLAFVSDNSETEKTQSKGGEESKNNDKSDKEQLEEGGETKNYQVQAVKYPKEMDSLEEKWKLSDAYLKNLKPFYQQTMGDILTGSNGDNVAYSPINLYLCMAMLTEMTSGQTQAQLLDALGQTSLDEVREQSQNIWYNVYEDNAISKCILGDSIWLNEDIPYDKDVLKILADNYYASTYQGQMGTKSMDKTVQDWINNMTGNALKEQANELKTSADTVLMLLSSALFYDQWSTKFAKENTKEGTFYNADGSTVKCDFMNRTNDSSFYKKEGFLAVRLGFENGKCMCIFLPNEGVTVEEMLQKDMKEILHISSDRTYEEAVWGEVTLHLPKFQITTSHLDLIPTMKNMGITELFDAGADFEKLLGKGQSDLLYVSKAEQSTRVAVDENGCSVASFTEVALKEGAAMTTEKCTINCNRPFLFVISDRYNGIPVFTGVVNEMGE